MGIVRDGRSQGVTLRCPEAHSDAIDAESWNMMIWMLISVLEPHVSSVMKHSEGSEPDQFTAL